jgi:hypothetical protein
LARNEAVVIYRHYHNIVERSETVVKIDNLLIVTYVIMIPPLDKASRGDFNGGVVEISVNFRHDDPFFAL